MFKIFTLLMGMIIYCLGLFGKVSPGVAVICCIAGVVTALSVDVFTDLFKTRHVFSEPVLFTLAAIGSVGVSRYYEAAVIILLYHLSAWLFPRLLPLEKRSAPSHRRADPFLWKINDFFTPLMIAASILITTLSFCLTGDFFKGYPQSLICLILAGPLTYSEHFAGWNRESSKHPFPVGMALQLAGKLVFIPLFLCVVVSPWAAAACDTGVKLLIVMIYKFHYRKG